MAQGAAAYPFPGRQRALAGPVNHASIAHAAERLAALVDEHVGRLNAIRLLLPVQFETIHLIPLQVMDAVGAALEPADDDGPVRQVDVIPTQIASLGEPQAAMTAPVTPSSLVTTCGNGHRIFGHHYRAMATQNSLPPPAHQRHLEVTSDGNGS
jgi:hypothetical protein